MITRRLLEGYLTEKLGEPKYSHQGLKYNCPKCDHGKKYNLEIKIGGQGGGFYNCWGCRYSGHINKLMDDYACDLTWKPLPEFKDTRTEVEITTTKELNYPTETIPFYLNKRVTDYLINERQMEREELIRRGVCYVYSENEMYHDHICFPYYKRGKMIGACLQNFKTKKYRNLGPLDFVPYEEFIDIAYPITITEGNYDALSGINAIPILKTEINNAVLAFVKDKDVILALDNTVELDLYTMQMKRLESASIKSLTLFDMSLYKDLNEYFVKNKKQFIKEYTNCFDKILERNYNREASVSAIS